MTTPKDYIPTDPKPILIDSELYKDGTCRILCGLHAGMSARYTGRSSSGVKLKRATGKADCCAMCGRKAQ